MRKLCSKILVFTLVAGSLLPVMQPKAADGRVQNDKAFAKTVAHSHKYLARNHNPVSSLISCLLKTFLLTMVK